MANDGSAFGDAATRIMKRAWLDISDEMLYGEPQWHNVNGSKDELIKRIKELSLLEQTLMGVIN